MGYYGRLANDYTNSPLSYDALNRIAQVYRKQGDATNEIAALTVYAERLEARAKPGQELVTARFLLAQATRALHYPALRADDPEVAKAANAGIVGAANLYGRVLRMLEPAEIDKYQSSEDEKKRNQTIREGTLFGRAYCMSILTQPADKLAELKKQAILTYEEMLKAFPKSEFAPGVLMQIGTLWTTLGDADPDSTKKADEAFTRLSQQFPDSTEAKLALFQRAKILIELGFRSQGVALLKQMFEDTGKYTAGQMLTVGQELLKSKEHDMALQAFDFALAGAKENDGVRMPAMLGRADIMIAQGKVAEAVEVLDGFLTTFKRSTLTIDANLKLSHAASEHAITLDDRDARVKMFNKAVDAMKRVRQIRTEPGELARTDNDIGRILLRKAEAERRLKDDVREKEYTMQAIAHFVSVMDSGDATVPEVVPHLEESYHIAIPLMMQVKEFGDAKEYAERYVTLFPNGRYTTDIRNWLNEVSISLTTR
jgi:TolA-binding protein